VAEQDFMMWGNSVIRSQIGIHANQFAEWRIATSEWQFSPVEARSSVEEQVSKDCLVDEIFADRESAKSSARIWRFAIAAE